MEDTYYYSNSTFGIYSERVHGKKIPDDATKISDEVRQQLAGAPHGTRLDVVDGEIRGLIYPEPQAAERRAEILARLFAIDTDSIRPAREIASAIAAAQEAPAFAESKLAALEAEAVALRAELRELQA